MKKITVTLPEDVATELEAEHVNREELDVFVVAAVKVWLKQREVTREEIQVPWSAAFRESAVPFVEQLIDENRDLFEELAQS